MSTLEPPVRGAGCPVAHGPLSAERTPTGCPVSQRAADFDPFEDGYQQDPPEYVRWAREQEPIFWSPKLGYWVVTRYDDIKAIFRDNITFSPSIALEKITPTGDEANAVLASYGFALNRTLVNEDEPAHMPRRRALMHSFTPEELKHHEPMVRQLAREYVDRFIDDGKADLVDQILWEIPLTVALHFLGVPEEDMDTLRKYSIAHTVNTWGRPKPEEQVAVAHAVGNFWQFAGKVLDKMRQDLDGPGAAESDGWMQYGLRKQRELPDVVTDSYLHSMMMAGIVAAHETTANASANAMKLLLQHPDAWREVCEDASLIPNAVEECLRHNGSVAAWRRMVTKDSRIDGVDLPAGSKLLIVTSSANHDEAHFPDGDLFDIRRDNASDHLTFGYGSHQCMGKNLARMEMQIFLEEFSRRLPHMRLAPQQFSYVPNTSFRGPSICGSSGTRCATPSSHIPRCVVRKASSHYGWVNRRRVRSLGWWWSRASRRWPKASSSCAWSHPMDDRCRVGRRARTSTSNADIPMCRASTRCAAILQIRARLKLRCCVTPRAAVDRAGSIRRSRSATSSRFAARATTFISTSPRASSSSSRGASASRRSVPWRDALRNSASTTSCTTAVGAAPRWHFWMSCARCMETG